MVFQAHGQAYMYAGIIVSQFLDSHPPLTLELECLDLWSATDDRLPII